MKRIFLFLCLSLVSLMLGIALAATLISFFISPNSDYASTLGRVTGLIIESILTLPTSTLANLRLSPLFGCLALFITVSWLCCAVFSPKMSRRQLGILAFVLPIIWVACLTAV